MTGQLAPRRFGRRGRRALQRMTERQRAIFLAMRFENIGFADLADRHGISMREVEAEFAEALEILVHAFREPQPWWRRLW